MSDLFKDVLQSIHGIEIFPLLGLALFALTFVGVIIWAWKLDKHSVDYLSALPLDDGDAAREGE